MLSPIMSYLIDEFTSIENTAASPINYSNNYHNIISNIVPSINAQITRYVPLAMESIKAEIAEELSSEIDFASLKAQVINDLKSISKLRTFQPSPYPQCNAHPTLIDVNFISAPNESTSSMHDHFQLIIHDMHQFEEDICQYKRTLKSYIKSCIPNMISKYESLVRNSIKNKRDFPKLTEFMISEINRLMP